MKRTLAYLVMGLMVSMAIGGLFSSAVADTEPNDSFEQSESIAPGQYVGALGTQDPVDNYNFNLLGGSKLVLNCTLLGGDKARYTLFDFNKGQIANSSYLASAGNWQMHYYSGQQLARYYLVVDRDIAGTEGFSNYQFTAVFADQMDGDFLGDAGDDMNSPKNVTGKLHFNGTVGDADSADFYSIDCRPGDQVHLTLGVQSGQGIGLMKFYDNNKVEKAKSPPVPAGQAANIDMVAGDPGTYYIEVYSDENHAGKGIEYYVNVSNVPKPPPDVEPPTIEILSPLDGATLDKTTVVISGRATDNRGIEKVEISVNAGPLQTADGREGWSKAMVLAVGQNTIKAKAIDTAGLCATQEISVTVTGTGQTNDTVAPNITITEPADGIATVEEHLEVKGTASDDQGLLRVEVKVNNGTWMVVPGTDTWQMLVQLDNGVNRVMARAVDTSGNTATRQVMIYRVLAQGDGLAPNAHFTDPMNSAALKQLVYTVKGVANDNTALLKVDVSLNGGPHVLATPVKADWTQWSFSALFVAGNNTLSARAMDTGGLVGFDNITIYASAETNDTIPPMVNITFPSSGMIFNVSRLTVSGTAADHQGGVVRVEVSLNDGAWQLATGTVSWTFTTTMVEGSNLVKVRAVDRAANVNTSQVTVVYNATADLLKPTLNIDYPKPNATFSSDKADIKGTAADNVGVDKVELTLNGVKMAVLGNTTWKARVTLKEGKNAILVTAYDKAGNMASKEISVTYKKPTAKPPIPGFEVVFLAGAIAVAVLLLGRTRRG